MAKKVKKVWYTGIADNEGIESFMPLSGTDEQERYMWYLRAESNPQRFATVYKAELDIESAELVTSHLDKGNYLNALRCMHYEAKRKNFEVEASHKKNWALITKHSYTLNKIMEASENG